MQHGSRHVTGGLLLEVHVVSKFGLGGRVSLCASSPRLRPGDGISLLFISEDGNVSHDHGVITLDNLVGNLSGVFLNGNSEFSFGVVGVLLEFEEVSGGGGNNARNDTSGSHLNFFE